MYEKKFTQKILTIKNLETWKRLRKKKYLP